MWAGEMAQLESTYCENMRSRVQTLELMESQACRCESATLTLGEEGQGAGRTDRFLELWAH